MRTLRLMLLLVLALLFAPGAAAEEPSLFVAAESTPSLPLAAPPSPAPSPAQETGFFLEAVRPETVSAVEKRDFRVLIYHTHTYEAYTATEAMPYTPTEKWRTANSERNMVAVGAYLTELLQSAGIQAVHDVTAFEPPQLSSAYERSLKMLTERQAQGEQYDLYIDLHRDAYSKNNGPNTVEKDGADLARLLILVGKGTGQTGAGYADKPNWEKNRAIAQALSNRLNLQCDGLCRGVSLKSGRYNQHVADCCILIEAGNNYNTLEEALAAMPYLANAICALADGQIE